MSTAGDAITESDSNVESACEPRRGDLQAVLSGCLLVCIAVLLLTLLWSTGGVEQIGIFLLVAALLWSRWAPELTHPLVWFIPPFTLYSISYPILCVFGLYSYDEAVQRSLAVHGVALLGFSVPLIWVLRRHPRLRLLPLRERAAELGAGSIFVSVIPLIAIGTILVVSLGATTKRELAESGSISTIVTQAAITLSMVSGTILVAARLMMSRRVPALVWVLALISVFALLYLGERDFIVRLAVSCVLLAWDTRRRPKMSTAIALGLIGFAMLPLLQSMKAVALGNTFTYSFEVMALFGQEFRSMGQNTWMIVASEGPSQVHGWAAVAMELKRTFASSLVGLDGVSLTAWYNETYFGSALAGRGFSMVGAAYLMGGPVAVAVLYALAGLLFAWLYMRRSESIYRLAFYVLLVPAFVYAQRADVSNFAGPAIKSLLIPVLIIAVISEMLVAHMARARSASRAHEAQ